jgi:hypothetical protein
VTLGFAPNKKGERKQVEEKQLTAIAVRHPEFGVNKKGELTSTFFAPNLTMNLTYLCYGMGQI